jgi:peroxiredoxin
MKKWIAILSIGIAGLLMAFAPQDNTLKIGAEMPERNVEMVGVDGQMYTLNKLMGEKGLLVIFSCNTCPFVLGWQDQYPKIADKARSMNMGMVLVNSNEAKRDNEDAPEAMKEHASEFGYNMPYVIDENHVVADAFGARTTPHVFLFNADGVLVFEGSINDKYENREEIATQQYLHKAMNELNEGLKISQPQSQAIGCSIKRVKL